MTARRLKLFLCGLLALCACATPSTRNATPTSAGTDPGVPQQLSKNEEAGLRRCYQDALSNKESIQAEVIASFVLGADGRIGRLDFDSSELRSPAAEACAENLLRQVQFAPPSEVGVNSAYLHRFEVIAGKTSLSGRELSDASEQHIRALIASSAPYLDACYAARPQLAGSTDPQLSLRLLFNDDGRADAVIVSKKDLLHPGTRNCLSTTLQSIQFPILPHNASLVVTLPLSAADRSIEAPATTPHRLTAATENDNALGVLKESAGGPGLPRMGRLDKGLIKRVIVNNIARYKSCYEARLKVRPVLQGTVRTHFFIEPDGTVDAASIAETSLLDAVAEDCILQVTRSLRFPKPKGGGRVVVKYPFVFQQRGGTTPPKKGWLSKSEIARVIRNNLKQFKNCYEVGLKAKPGLQGAVRTRFIIKPDGTVHSASVTETTLLDAAVEECIVRAAGSLRFPKPRGGGIVVVKYPFNFRQSK